MPSKTTTEQIRNLNDELRQNFIGGRAVITPGVAALGQAAVARIIKTIAVFDDSARPTTPTASMTLARSRRRGARSFSRSIISTPG